MLNYFGKNYGYKALTDRVGNFSQLAGARRYAFSCGRSKGVEAVDIRTGTGLNYTILPDRALDIAFAEFKGIPLGFMSPAGVVAAQYYDPTDNEWLRSFSGGLMTTCGLSNVGAASELNGIKYGQHGRISNLPVENTIVEEGFDGREYVISVKGQVRQVKPFFENMVLHRTIQSYAGKNMIMIRDVVENRGASRQPFMLLYHFNFGFPLVNEHSGIFIPNRNKTCTHQKKEFDLTGFDRFKNPEEGFEEQTFFFETIPDQNGDAHFLLANDRDSPELAIKVKYSYNPLNRLVVWKYLNEKNYVLCVEPANCHVKGIAYEYGNGTLQYLEPSEKKEINIEIEVLEGKEEINRTVNMLKLA